MRYTNAALMLGDADSLYPLENKIGQKYALLLAEIRNTRVTPAPHIQGKNMNKKIRTTYDPKYFKTRQTRQFCGHILFIFLPCMWGIGVSKCFPKKVAHTAPICITMQLPFESQRFCRSVRVRGRWNTLNELLLAGSSGSLLLKDDSVPVDLPLEKVLGKMPPKTFEMTRKAVTPGPLMLSAQCRRPGPSRGYHR